MAEKETITLDAAALQMLVTGGVAKRGLNTEWTVVITLKGDVPLGDGRSLQIDRDVHVKARQQGRKPNPAKNWKKGQRGFSKKAKKQ
jgi:hypothetical protein